MMDNVLMHWSCSGREVREGWSFVGRILKELVICSVIVNEFYSENGPFHAIFQTGRCQDARPIKTPLASSSSALAVANA